MKPEGNRVEIRIGRNVRLSGTIGYEEEAPAESCNPDAFFLLVYKTLLDEF